MTYQVIMRFAYQDACTDQRASPDKLRLNQGPSPGF